jgi:hypothetical protein
VSTSLTAADSIAVTEQKEIVEDTRRKHLATMTHLALLSDCAPVDSWRFEGEGRGGGGWGVEEWGCTETQSEWGGENIG